MHDARGDRGCAQSTSTSKHLKSLRAQLSSLLCGTTITPKNSPISAAKKPTPYMERLRFTPARHRVADPDTRMLSDEELKQASKEADERK
jgi:hypothetical protein